MAPVVTPRVVLKVRSAADVGLRHDADSAVTTVDPCAFVCDRRTHRRLQKRHPDS